MSASSQGSFVLRDVQSWMQQMIIPADSDPDDGLRSLEKLVMPSKRMSAAAHLAIYQRGYTARLRECMRVQFSALDYALGANLFQGFADEYLTKTPSTSYTLADLGSRFAAFLEQTRPDREGEREDWPDFMIELISFEFDISRAFDQICATPYRLADSQTPDDQLRLLPVAYLHAFQFPIRSYYRAFKNDEMPALPLPFATYCAITRHEQRVGLMDLNGSQFVFLDALRRGDDFGQAKSHLLSTGPFEPAKWEEIWPQWKRDWLDAGLLCHSAIR